MSEIRYIVHGATICCSKSNDTSQIIATINQGVYYLTEEKTFMVYTDCLPYKNIIPFSSCNAGKSIFYTQTEKETEKNAPPSFNPMSAYNTILPSNNECGDKCIPVFLETWQNYHPYVFINDEYILTDKSKLYCDKGGIITFKKHEAGQIK